MICLWHLTFILFGSWWITIIQILVIHISTSWWIITSNTEKYKANLKQLALIAIDTAWPIPLVVAHVHVERAVDRNLKIVRSQTVTMCVRVWKQTTLYWHTCNLTTPTLSKWTWVSWFHLGFFLCLFWLQNLWSNRSSYRLDALPATQDSGWLHFLAQSVAETFGLA